VLSKEATTINIIVFGLTRLGPEHMIYHTQGYTRIATTFSKREFWWKLNLQNEIRTTKTNR
jgi:hypothetical protein